MDVLYTLNNSIVSSKQSVTTYIFHKEALHTKHCICHHSRSFLFTSFVQTSLAIYTYVFVTDRLLKVNRALVKTQDHRQGISKKSCFHVLWFSANVVYQFISVNNDLLRCKPVVVKAADQKIHIITDLQKNTATLSSKHNDTITLYTVLSSWPASFGN